MSSDFSQVRRDGAGEDDAVDALVAVLRGVAGDLAAAHREADERDVVQVELGEDRVQVVGEGVVVVAGGAEALGLVAAAEAAAVVRDDAVAGLRERAGLLAPGLAGQGPAVDQDDGAAGAAAVLDVEVDAGEEAVLDGDVGHGPIMTRSRATDRGRVVGAAPDSGESPGQGSVRTSAPVSVTTSVCSNCAHRLPSTVSTVQSSSHM